MFLQDMLTMVSYTVTIAYCDVLKAAFEVFMLLGQRRLKNTLKSRKPRELIVVFAC